MNANTNPRTDDSISTEYLTYLQDRYDYWLSRFLVTDATELVVMATKQAQFIATNHSTHSANRKLALKKLEAMQDAIIARMS